MDDLEKKDSQRAERAAKRARKVQRQNLLYEVIENSKQVSADSTVVQSEVPLASTLASPTWPRVPSPTEPPLLPLPSPIKPPPLPLPSPTRPILNIAEAAPVVDLPALAALTTTISPPVLSATTVTPMPRAPKRGTSSWASSVWALVSSLLSAVGSVLWSWKLVIFTILALLYVLGVAMETIESVQVVCKDVLCGWGRPLLTALGTAHICFSPQSMPVDPFGSRRIAGFMTHHMPQLLSVPQGLAEQKANISDIWSLVEVNRHAMFPTHGKTMVHLSKVIHGQLEECWRQSVRVGSTAETEMSLLALKMRQTATEANRAVQVIDQRSQSQTILLDFASRLLYFVLPYTKNHRIIHTFIFQIDDTMPRLTAIITEAEVLHTHLDRTSVNLRALDVQLKLEHVNFQTMCHSYTGFQWFRRPKICSQWPGRYENTFAVIKAMQDTIFNLSRVLESSADQLVAAREHVETTKRLLQNAHASLLERNDIKVLRPEVLNLLRVAENYQTLVHSIENISVADVDY